MLESHLDSHWDSATRRHEFVDRSAVWISAIAPPEKYPSLLDLGCGPGLFSCVHRNVIIFSKTHKIKKSAKADLIFYA